MNRDASGRTTIRAITLDEGITVDGRLDERVYDDVPAVRDFIQQVPIEGATPTERTEAWVMFDGVTCTWRPGATSPRRHRSGGERDAARLG